MRTFHPRESECNKDHPMKSEVVYDGIPFAEGPVWCGNRTLVVTSVAEGALYRVEPEQHRATRFADTGGGANGAALAADGSILVTQNGGFEFAATGLFADPPPFRAATPGLQLATAGGTVTYLADTGFRSPNDLAVSPDGAVYFTDPPHYPPPDDGAGRVMRYDRDGSVSTYASGFRYCNGIAFEPNGTMVVVERQGLQRVHADGSRDWVIEVLGRGAGDGFCLDADGRFYVASTVEHGVRVVDTDGTIIDFLAIDGDGLTTNCCFGGADLHTLFVTDALPGRVVAFEGMPTPGLPLSIWPGPA
jgi:gluconolactonase